MRGRFPSQSQFLCTRLWQGRLKYNIDYKVELLDKAVRYAELEVSTQEGLPSLVANSEYYSRNNLSGGTSRQILSSKRAGDVSLSSSTSQERSFITGDMSLSWNVLDFGLSKVRAEQNADRVLIAEESKRRHCQSHDRRCSDGILASTFKSETIG